MAALSEIKLEREILGRMRTDPARQCKRCMQSPEKTAKTLRQRPSRTNANREETLAMTRGKSPSAVAQTQDVGDEIVHVGGLDGEVGHGRMRCS